MHIPPYLNHGDTIAIVAPARKISKEEVQPAITLLENSGFRVRLGANLFEENNQFAGTDAQRIADFQSMLDDDSIKAILCARGGYGSIRVAEAVDFTPLSKSPKWIVGYSDVTVFHSRLHNMDISTAHATMPINFPKDGTANASTQSLLDLLTGREIVYAGSVHSLNKIGKAEGVLVGGNLSMLYSLRGTNYDLDTDGKILFIEDLDEYLYHVDRMMMNLKAGGLLSNLAGLIVGGMNDMNDNTVPFGKTAMEIIVDAISEYNYPVLFDFQAGHIETNLALKLGARVSLEVEDTYSKIQFH